MDPLLELLDPLLTDTRDHQDTGDRRVAIFVIQFFDSLPEVVFGFFDSLSWNFVQMSANNENGGLGGTCLCVCVCVCVWGGGGG